MCQQVEELIKKIGGHAVPCPATPRPLAQHTHVLCGQYSQPLKVRQNNDIFILCMREGSAGPVKPQVWKNSAYFRLHLNIKNV